jgi:hypothetical protein
MALNTEGVSIEHTASASTRGGTATKISVSRMISVSMKLPFIYPAMRPSVTPTGAVIHMTTTPIPREKRNPKNILERISLPKTSVPQRCFQLGGLLASGKFT